MKITEGGTMPGVGAIHIDEIEPTLDALESRLGINLKNNTLGSVGKRTFSGDIDIALQIDPEDIPAFVEKLKSIPGVDEVAKSSVIMTKVPIQNYDDTKQAEGKTRTGFVQVDFMPGDPGWLKTFYHAPRETESKYKGVLRNILVSSICGHYERKDSEETIEDGRPLEMEKWMFSPTEGLVRVRRTPVPKKSGQGYTKKNKNEIISKPRKTASEIAKTLGLDGPEDLNSYESLKAAIEKNYPQDLVDQILDDFKINPQVQDVGVPNDLKNEALERIRELAGL
jgi:hypothetical protein